MCVYMYILVYLYLTIYLSIYLYTYIYIYVCTYVCMYVFHIHGSSTCFRLWGCSSTPSCLLHKPAHAALIQMLLSLGNQLNDLAKIYELLHPWFLRDNPPSLIVLQSLFHSFTHGSSKFVALIHSWFFRVWCTPSLMVFQG